MAAEYSRELSAKVLAGQLRLSRLGFKMGGRAAYGLQRRVVDDNCRSKEILTAGERKFLITDRVKLIPGALDQIAVVRWIFNEYIRCKSQATVARELNRRGILAARGGLWTKSSISMLLHNESYVGTLIFNRHSRRLGAKRTDNPKDCWIKIDGAIEPIIERDVFLCARKIMQERRHASISEEEMLVRLRKLLLKKGQLSAPIINASPSLPSASAYVSHFGNLQNLYRLIGYAGNQRWEAITAYKRWRKLQLDNAACLRGALEKVGRHATFDPTIEGLRIDNAVNICFRVARCRKYERYPLRWTLVRRKQKPSGWVVAVRLGENNETVLDYVLLRSAWLSFGHRFFWFDKDTCAGHRIERFDNFEKLSRLLIKRVCQRTLKPRPGRQRERPASLN